MSIQFDSIRPTMELLRPFHPHHGVAMDPLSEFSSPESYRRGFDQTASFSRSTEAVHDGEKVYVAVGRTVDKAIGLIRWCSESFSGREICIVHVHQPSPLIPTLLGKLPVTQASVEVVSTHRREEKLQLKKLLMNYLAVCRDLKVEVSVVAAEAEQVHKGIVEMVDKFGIKRLVMGAVPENCMKVKKSFSKASYAARNAPSFCEILFVSKGKHIWTRDATEGPMAVVTCTIPLRVNEEALRCESLSQSENNSVPLSYLEPSAKSIGCTGLDNWLQGQAINSEVDFPNSSCQCLPSHCQSSCSHTSTSTGSGCSSDERMSLDNKLKVEEKRLYNHLIDAQVEQEASNNESVQELLKCQQLETAAMEAISRVKIFECAYANEAELRKEAEDALRTVAHDHEKLLEEREELKKEVQRTMRNIALLESRACEINRRRDEAAEELHVVQLSIATLRLEKQRLWRHKMEAVHWLERWRSCGPTLGAKCNWYPGLGEDMPELAEFSLSEIQTATCYFSESFKIGQGGYGCVYKGEMLGRTVAIKKLHPHNMQGQFEFQQEVQVLSKLQHPHLVNLLGVCPEAWSLVYEYLPNGSLQERLFQKNSHTSLTWKHRARMIAEVSSSLCFLHSSKPEKIVHGDLKPENILLDSDLSCKICDFGICRLVSEDTFYCSSFRRSAGPGTAFPHSDPESYREGLLTPKSDTYSFGLIILQLLTGRPPVGLVGEVRKALSCGNLDLILDSSAGEWPQSVAIRLATLGLECCESNRRSRPDLTPSLVRELEQLHATEERSVPNYFLCPILQEIMHDPQIAADGFTYEGEAIRGWLKNGRDTSPMTNLKLSHLNLTPNHVLRIAIQDWLCKV